MTRKTLSDRGVTTAEMRAHVEELIANLNRSEDDYTEVRWINRPTRAWAASAASVICLPRVRSSLSYATALHEFGHFWGRHQRSRRVLVREREAWAWARLNALVWTPRMERYAQAALAWYAARHGAAAWNEPPPLPRAGPPHGRRKA